MKHITYATHYSRTHKISGTKQIFIGLVLAVTFMAPHRALAAGPAPVDLGSCANFVVLAETTITTTGGGNVNGNVGLSPAGGTAILLTCPQVTGTIYVASAGGPTLGCQVVAASLLTQAVNDMVTAYGAAAGRTPVPSGPNLNPGAPFRTGVDIGGMTFAPGLYKFDSRTTCFINTDVTLSGGPSDVWIFQCGADLEMANWVHITLAGGANANNIFWQVTTKAVLGTNSVFNGTILAGTSIVMNTGSTMNGRALAQAQVAFGPVTIVQTNRAPTITTQPQSQTVQAGSNVTFSVVASGLPSPNYQWQFNGQNIAGRTTASLSLTNVQFANAGGYLVIITNAYGSVTSAVAQLTVYTNMVLIQTNRTPKNTEIGSSTIPTNPNYFKVFTNGNFVSGVGLNPNKNTVVLTHGWNGRPSDWAAYTAQIIQQRIGINAVNIVAWDWTADATSSIPDLGVIAAKTPGEGTALGTNLVAALGANYSKRLHFVGHSLGTLVNGAAADYVHTHGFAWTNTQMTLCDEAEAAWELNSTGWQMATTLPDKIGQLRSSLSTLNGNFSTPQRYWDHPLPKHFAWADNYISACGLLHPDAANAILTYEYPDDSSPDFASWKLQWFNFHDYSHYFYEDTIEPSIYNTGGQINATYMGFICSFEGGGIAGRPATNTVFYQDTIGLELHLVQTNFAFATNFLNGRFDSFFGTAAATGEAIGWNAFGQALGQVNGQIESAGQNLKNMVLNFFTSVSSGSLVQNSGAHPLGGPVPLGGGAGNTPAYAWIPLTIPSNSVSMSFDFMLQGNGNQDSFQVALNGTNILSLETSLIQTNVTLNSGLINVSKYAGTNVELFLGIVGGTSTNAQLTVSDIQFYSVALPSLQAQASGSNLMLSWPLSAQNFSLQTTTNLADPNSWMTLTNVPAIVNLQNAVTNPVSDGARFYRLKK